MINYLKPDLPTLPEMLPFMQQIDRNQFYSNFGPLHGHLKQSLQKLFFKYLTTENMALTSTGTSAIEACLAALALPPQSKIIVPSFTFPATIHAVLNTGHVPVIADIDPETWQLSPTHVEKLCLDHQINAIIPVASFGIPIDNETWVSISNRYDIPVVIDAAAALGNQKVHPQLHYCFSMHATKPFGCGEGGLILSFNKELIERVNKIINFGFENGEVVYRGTNAKLSEYHSAVGLAQAKRFPVIQERRKAIFNLYLEQLSQISDIINLQPGTDTYTPASLIIHSSDISAGEIQQTLKENEIESKRLYWPLIQNMPYFQDKCIFENADLIHAHYLSESCIALPFHNFMNTKDVSRITETILNLSHAQFAYFTQQSA